MRDDKPQRDYNPKDEGSNWENTSKKPCKVVTIVRKVVKKG